MWDVDVPLLSPSSSLGGDDAVHTECSSSLGDEYQGNGTLHDWHRRASREINRHGWTKEPRSSTSACRRTMRRCAQPWKVLDCWTLSSSGSAACRTSLGRRRCKPSHRLTCKRTAHRQSDFS